MLALSGDDFDFLARLLRRRGGLVLTPDKAGLFERRLKPVLHRFGFKDLTALIQELRLGQEALADAVTEAMTVNETSFFRDPALLARLRDHVLPRLVASRAKAKRLRIWSCACAAGQEAYSIAMMLDELGLNDWLVDLIATDLSGEAIARAQRGHYTEFEMQRGLTPAQIDTYFTTTEDGHAVEDRLRRMVNFRRFNLLDSYGWLDDLDIVLCRNVLIYFDGATRTSILERLAETLAEDGALLLGDAETPHPFTGAFAELPGGPGLYGKTRIASRFSRTG